MTNPVTMIIPIKLAEGKTEGELLKASHNFQTKFATHEKGILKREFLKKSATEFIDIVQFRTAADIQDIMEKEKTEPTAIAFFALLDPAGTNEADLVPYESLATY